MSSDRSRFRARSLSVLALCLSVLSGSAQSPALRIVSAGPTGELSQLGDAEQIRIVFSEPMVPLGTLPSAKPSWLQITPSTAGSFYWSGTRTLIFSPDASSPVPFSTSVVVRVDATAMSVAGRSLGEPYEFTFTTPTVRLLHADWYRQTPRFDSPAMLILRFNQPVRPADVLSHATVALTPHPWTAPELSPQAREWLKRTNPAGLSRFEAKVDAVRRITSSSDPIAVRLAQTWNEKRFPRAPEVVVLETTAAPPPDSWLTIAIDATMPSPQGPRTATAHSNVVKLEPTFFVSRMTCEGPCAPSAHNMFGLNQSVTYGALAQALKVADVTDPPNEVAVVPERRLEEEVSRRSSSYLRVQALGFPDQLAGRTWRLELAPDLTATDGQTLGYPWVGLVEHMHDAPFVSFDGGVWEAERGTDVPLNSRNVLSITEWLTSVERGSVMTRLLELTRQAPAQPPAGGRLRRLPLVPDTVQAHTIDIAKLLSTGGTGVLWAALAPADLLPRYMPPSGAPYEVVDRTDPRRLSRGLIQVTNLGITVKDSPQSTLVFVTRLDTGTAVPDANVAIVDTGNRVVWRGTTDRDGVALAPALALRVPSRPWQFSFVVTATKGDDFAFVGSNWNDGIAPEGFGYGNASPLNALRGHVFTDRGVYMAGEEVHAKAVLRDEVPTGMRLLATAAALDVVVLDSRGKEVDRRVVKVNTWSSAEWTWRVPRGSALGHYRFELSRSGIKTPDLDMTAIAGGFLVAAYRRPTVRVEATLSSDPLILGSTLHAAVDARYLSGAALARRPVEWLLERERVQRPPDAVRDRYPESGYAVGYVPEDEQPSSEEKVAESEEMATLELDGHLSIPLSTKAESDLAYRYRFSVAVEDLSGQHIADSDSLVVHPAAVYVALSRPPIFVDTKRETQIAVAAVDLSGRAVPGLPVVVSLFREQWVEESVADDSRATRWRRRETKAGEWTVRTTAGETPVTFAVTDGGRYLLRAIARDADGRQTRTETAFYALGGAQSTWRSDRNQLDLTPERTTWKPGESARILVHSPWPHATGLLTVEREGVRSHRRFTVTSTQDTIDVPISEADVPNVYVSVVLVKGRTPEETGAIGSEAERPAYRVGYAHLTVDDSSKRLRVDVVADRNEYRPQERANVSVVVTSPDGAPARSEVTFWAIDQGLLSLTDYATPDLLRAIYPQRYLQVLTSDSRERLLTSRSTVPDPTFLDLLQTSATAASTVAHNLAALPSPPASSAIRTDFRPLVFWVGSATTDANGRATTTVTLPDSLTTYRIMAVAGDRASQFGFGEREIRVSKPLTLVPAFPRFLSQGDRASFGAVVTNAGKQAGSAIVTIESLTPDILQFSSDSTQTQPLAPAASESVRFNATVPGAGTARVRMTVTLGGETDAFEMPLDVSRPMRVETTAAYGETVSTATENLTLPSGVVRAFGGMTVELASTALVGLGEAARYLDEYPYDCAEQKASRVLALLLAADVGGAFRLTAIKPSDYRSAAAATLDELYGHQCEEGGFSLWPGKCQSQSAYLTSYVLHAMKVGETSKIAIKQSALDRALDYLQTTLNEAPPQGEWWPVWAASQAYAAKVLAEFSRTPPSKGLDRLVDAADRLPLISLSYLADALAASNNRDSRYRDLVRRLTNAVRIEADRAHVEEIDEAALAWLWNTNTRATAVVLEGLSRRKDDPTLIAPLVRWLVAARTNGRWGTTHENAMALEALVAYYRAFERETPRMTATVTAGSTTVGTAAFTGRSTMAQELRMPMPALVKEMSSSTSPVLTVSRTGTGRLYYTARVKALVPEPPSSVDRGFLVERRYERYLKDGTSPPSTSFSTGDLVRVTVAVTIRGEGRYLALTDPLPAGFEAVDELFSTTARDLAREATRTGADNDRRGWWRGGDFDHVEKHADRVVAFATRLGSGRHVFSYLARATTAGTFGVGGARLEAMYAPELEGRSQAATVTVTVK